MIDTSKKIVIEGYDYSLIGIGSDGVIFGEVYREYDWWPCVHNSNGDHCFGIVDKPILNAPETREYILCVDSMESSNSCRVEDSRFSVGQKTGAHYRTGNLKITEEMTEGKWKVVKCEVMS